ncbi:hypothetical protein SAMN05660206_101362 [Sphingobacterium wenxiniae]|uniref:Glycoamylase-like domain-containing protein n=2 Tax=Sphingobacterium wenxiniae TaxID=683125 RepID=A0A1I6PAK7_9SPHI|nr:hypothetical protein SAMN05660206_101362 [Sphingobacterium wenxiniae]
MHRIGKRSTDVVQYDALSNTIIMQKFLAFAFITLYLCAGCSKEKSNPSPTNNPTFKISQILINEEQLTAQHKDVNLNARIQITFESSITEQGLQTHLELLDADRVKIPVQTQVASDKKTVTLLPSASLKPLSSYTLIIRNTLLSTDNRKLDKEYSYMLTTTIDLSDKHERISSEALLTKIQQQTFKYFWDHAHPAYGMIRERNTSNETVTIGGTGFGIMAIIVGAERGFISRTDGLNRIKKIVSFLKIADTYHGAFSHWYNGNTAKTLPFSEKDNGADLVETSLLFQGLLTAREYFDDAELQKDITTLYETIEWDFFRNGQSTLYWHWSPNYAWELNLPITGWNESLITYVLAAGSKDNSIAAAVYEQGWAKSGAMRNGKSYYGISLPLGPENGGPLFLSQYSFLGLNPFGLQDQYASYEEQVKNHSLINRAYCIANPKNFAGYSENCWGLTASDDINGYMAHSPTNDNGVISPTAALSSMPYTPKESMQALEFFYYKLGDKIWGEYGFKDAFSLSEPWFADSYLAIDQGPIIIGIENHRTGLLWKYFMQAPEIKKALQTLKFTSPNI